VLWFGSATNLSKQSSVEKLIKIGPDTISPSAVVHDLRVFFDCELNMKSHISRITRACFYHSASFAGCSPPNRWRSKSISSQHLLCCDSTTVTLFWLSSQHQLSHCCSEWWTPLPDWFVNFRQETTWRQHFNHFTGFRSSREFKLCLVVHLTINGNAPIYLKKIITRTASIPGRDANCSADNNDLVIQRTKLKFDQRAFSIAGPYIWNQLPKELKTTIDTATFKSKLKTFIFCCLIAITLFYNITLSVTNANVVIVMDHRSFCRWQHRHCIITITITSNTLLSGGSVKSQDYAK